MDSLRPRRWRDRSAAKRGSLAALPGLPGLHLAFARSAPEDTRSEGLLDKLDEIVDAASGLASLAGLDSPCRADAGRTQAEDASVLNT